MATTPSELRETTIAALELTVRKLNSATFMLALDTAPPEQRVAAGSAIIDAGLSRQKLRRARLDDIAAKLEAEEATLREATAGLNDAVADLKKVKAVLDGVGALLKVVGRIVALF